MARYDVPDETWALISSMLPPERHSVKGGRPYLEHRPVINGIFWVLCSGAPWRDLPERYGNWKTIFGCHSGQKQEQNRSRTAIMLLRQLDNGEIKRLPGNVPTHFVPYELQRILKGKDGKVQRNAWELSVAIAMKDALRSGDLFVPQSKQHVSFWESTSLAGNPGSGLYRAATANSGKR